MLFRFPITMAFGIGFYMLMLVMTDYDGFITVVFGPFFAALYTGIIVVLLLVLGSPLLMTKVWPVWRKHWYIAMVIFALGLLATLLSWLPALRVEKWNPDEERMLDLPHPALAIAGWLAMLFGLLYFPRLGLSPSKKWM